MEDPEGRRRRGEIAYFCEDVEGIKCLFGESALYVMNGMEGVCHPSSRSRDKLLAGMPRRLAVANIFAFLGLVFVREVARGIFQG